MKQISYSLHTRAWLAHILNMMSRVVFAVLGSAYWQKAYKEKDEIEELNHDFVDKSESALRGALLTLIIFGVLLDILCWKYRRYSELIIYYELIRIMVQAFVPIDHGETTNGVFFMQFLYYMILYSCKPGPNTIASTIAITIVLTC